MGDRFVSMKTDGTQHIVERAYREGGDFQWVREVLANSLEAGATRVEFGVEWQAVENLGVYRRVISDNGSGMTGRELIGFFNTLGKGGKPIGGEHENFGVGSKTSLLPWNGFGMVVISWFEGDAAMIWVHRNPETGEYGLWAHEVEDDDGNLSYEEAVEPFDDPENGVDWNRVKPDFIDSNGTVLVLLGEDRTTDTVLGDPNRDEGNIKGIPSYLNRRFWEIPDDTAVVVDELRTNDRRSWSKSETEAHGPQPESGADKRTNARKIRGARHYINYPTTTDGRIEASDVIKLADGTSIHWTLWKGERPAIHSYAAKAGYVAILYHGELYHVTSHASTFRSFGIADHTVRSNVWLVIEPPVSGGLGHFGVYPRGDRNGLLLRDASTTGKPLPMSDWAAEFADHMPDALVDALRAARKDQNGSLDDEWRDRLADRFGSRWKIDRLQAAQKGSETVTAGQPGSVARNDKKKNKKEKSKSGGTGGTVGPAAIGRTAGPKRAARKKVAGGLPHFEVVGSAEVSEGMIAAWQPNSAEYESGVVLLNGEHPVLVAEVRHWQEQYAEHLSEGIRKEVLDAYGQIAVAKLAHSEHLKGLLPASKIEDELRSEAALTMALLGLIGEEAFLSPRIAGKFGRRKAASGEESS